MQIKKKVSIAAGTVGSMTLLSRVFGFIRDLVIAKMFGATMVADAFIVAFRIPNVQRRLLGEGAVTAAFIPIFSDDLKNNRHSEAWEFASHLFNILLGFLLIVTVVLIILAPYLIPILAPGFVEDSAKFELTVDLTRWMAPFLIFIGLAALCMGILNACGIFSIPALSPVLLNISMIACGLFLAPILDEPIYGLVIGVLLGGVLQLAIQLPVVLRKGLQFSSSINWKQPNIIKFFKLVTPAILGLAVYEINTLVDTILASLLPEGSVSYLYYGNRLVQLPLGVFGVALGIAILPTLSEYAARKEISELKETLAFGIRLILFITIPATVGLILLRFPIVNTLWERGEFTSSATKGTAIALLFYSFGLCAFAGIKIIGAAYYSLQDSKTLMKVGIFSMILNIILNLIFMGPLKHGGLALATSLASIINCSLLIYFLKKKLGLMGGRKILTSIQKLIFAALPMGIIVYLLNEFFYDPGASLYYKLVVLFATIFIGVFSFGFISHLLKNEELYFLWHLVSKKI